MLHDRQDIVRIVVPRLNRPSGHGVLVMFEVTNPLERAHTVTKRHIKGEPAELKAILSGDDDFLRNAVRAAIQSALGAEMTEALAAERGERVDGRPGCRSGFYSRSLVTRVGTIELRVPRDSLRLVLGRTVRALPALGPGLGQRPGRDVCRVSRSAR
jgi:hypothetical protein